MRLCVCCKRPHCWFPPRHQCYNASLVTSLISDPIVAKKISRLHNENNSSGSHEGKRKSGNRISSLESNPVNTVVNGEKMFH